MQTHHRNWKTEITDLRTRAADVAASGEVELRMSARAAARCLSGVVAHVARQDSRDVMQRACAELVRCDDTWQTNFRILPRVDGTELTAAVELIAVVARGILPLAGANSMRAALAFWASEEDPAVWHGVVTGRSA